MALIEVDWDNFVFRSHYFGELMTKTKGKSNLQKYNEAVALMDKQYDRVEKITSTGATKDAAIEKYYEYAARVEKLKPYKDVPTLSGTAKRRLSQIYTEQTTGRVADIESMYLEKGIQTEEDCITLYSQATNTYYKKNKIRLNNGFVSGEIDFDDKMKDLIIDTKSTWDIFSFDKKVAIGLGQLYEWQGHCYMWLHNRKNFRLAYCLVDTPKEIVDRLIKKLEYTFIGDKEDLQEAIALLKDKHYYSDLPIERKIRVYDLKRDDEKIELAKSYIPHFREYLKNITNIKFQDDEFEDEFSG